MKVIKQTRIVWGQCPACDTPVSFVNNGEKTRICGICGNVVNRLRLVKIERKMLSPP